MFRKLLIVLATVAWTTHMSAQVATDAIVVGTVMDSSQGVIAGASVTLTHLATSATTKTITNSRGQYRTPPLRIGEYSLVIESEGFKQFIESGVILDIGSVRRVDAALEPGQIFESVDVQANPEGLLQSSDSTVGTVITNQQIVDLPLNGGTSGRDYLQLATLSSGTTPALGSSGGISIGGQAGSQVAFLLDGLDNNNQQISTGHSGQKEIIKPSVDAIEEFKVVTNGYSAEYGRSSSGVVSVQLKSGTNTIHGSAFEFLRNDAADARNYFAQQGLPYKQNDFGGTIGGPIRKDRVFAFGDIEFFRLRQQVPVYSLVPTMGQRSGQFSTVIYDPNTYNPTTKTRTAFKSNQIPSGRFDTVALNLLNYFPQPNFSTTGSANNYLYNSPQPTNNYRWDIRFDQIVSSKQSLYERFSSQQSWSNVVAPLPPLNSQYYSGSGSQTTDSRSFVVGYNTAWSQTMLASVRAGWNFLYWHNFLPKQSLTSIGIPGVETIYPGFSQIAVSNYATLGVSNVPNIDVSEDREIAADITWNRGRHTLKFGWQQFWLQTNFNSSQRSSGIFSFNGEYTSRSGSSGTVDQAFADFLLGISSKEQLSSTALLNFRTPYTHLFIQDDWKVTRNLALNLGLRYELSPPPVDKYNAIANFDLDTNASSPALVRAGSGGSNISARALQNVSYTGLAPRVGFAYSLPDNKTVVRGGYGIFYSNLITLGGMQSLEINPPASLPRVTISPNSTTPLYYLANGFPSGTLSFTNGKNVQLASYDRRAVVPTDQQWNLNVQRELPYGVVTEIGYYANKFDHSWWQIDGNPAPPTATSLLPAGGLNANRRFTTTTIPVTGSPAITLADVIRIKKEGWSQYDGLQVKVEKRYAKGLTFIASYAYSKTLGIGDTAGVQDQTNIAAERAATNTDMRNHFVGSVIYPLPFGRGRQFGSSWNRWADAALGGWSVSPILASSSGTPLNLTVSSNPSNTGGTADRPNVQGDWHLSHPTPSAWFNTSVFGANATGTYGSASRNLLLSQGTFNLDAAIHKTLVINERLTAQLRLESFNATNAPHFGSPGLDVNTAKSFGVITMAGAPRENQIAVKFLF
jgi:hypothetical protein